jgi:hypothetical protein
MKQQVVIKEVRGVPLCHVTHVCDLPYTVPAGAHGTDGLPS